MRPKLKQYPAAAYGPKPAYDTRQTILGTAVFVVMVLAAVLAIAYPIAVAAILGGVVLARHGVRVAHRLRQRRRMEGRARPICIPMIGICVEA